MAKERLYFVTYDISDSKPWRKAFRLLKGFGHQMQLSVFQCRLTARRRSEMMTGLECEIIIAENHVLMIDVGPTGRVELKIESLGKPHEAPKRHATVV